MFFFLFFLFFNTSSPQYRSCTRNERGEVVECQQVQWNPRRAQVPCEFLPPQFTQCITHSFDKFNKEFANGSVPDVVCNKGRRNEGLFGTAICHPLKGIQCVGEMYWINYTYPCYESGDYSLSKAIVLSFFVGLLGADRFYLGYYFLGFLKLFTVGGFFVWWIIDFILLAIGVWGPISGSYSLD